MKIRAITIGQKIPYLTDNKYLEDYLDEKLTFLSLINEKLLEQFNSLNIEVQTKRLCSQPILSYDKQLYEKNLNETLVEFHEQINLVERLITKYNIDYFASCGVLADYQIHKYGVYEKLFLNEIPSFIKQSEKFFTSLQVASVDNGINFSALKSGAKIIKSLSYPDPFSNLKFCISSNVSPDTPFFPAAYHLSENPCFMLALEMANEVVEVFEQSKTLTDAQNNLKTRFNEIYDLLVPVSEEIAKQSGIEFHGIDLSPAPYPIEEKSIGTAFERSGFEYFGSYGSLLVIGMIKNAIPKREKVIGFSGFMPSVLEDSSIAKSLSDGNFNLDSLLLYSTICGTGLDCVPLPGDITEQELFYILLDLCTISLRLNKPLTARLMPIPGKSTGDPVEFDFEYFAPSKVMAIRRISGNKQDDIFTKKEKYFNF